MPRRTTLCRQRTGKETLAKAVVMEKLGAPKANGPAGKRAGASDNSPDNIVRFACVAGREGAQYALSLAKTEDDMCALGHYRGFWWAPAQRGLPFEGPGCQARGVHMMQ